jgi:hypothetical protein
MMMIDGPVIHKQFNELGGFAGLDVSQTKKWMVSVCIIQWNCILNH